MEKKLKLTRSPGRLFHSVTTCSLKKFDQNVQLLIQLIQLVILTKCVAYTWCHLALSDSFECI